MPELQNKQTLTQGKTVKHYAGMDYKPQPYMIDSETADETT